MAESGKANLNMDNPPPYSPPYNPGYGFPPPADVQQVQYTPYPQANQPASYPPPPAQAYSTDKASAPPQNASAAPPVNHVIVVQQAAPTGNCPVCHTGNLVYEYTCCGILMAIIFFPIGILCCLFMKQGRCNHCGSCH